MLSIRRSWATLALSALIASAASAPATPLSEASAHTARRPSLSISNEAGTPGYFLQSVVAPTATDADSFGASLSSWKDTTTGVRWTVVGAPGSGSGSAFVFRLDPDLNQWVQVAKLSAGDIANGDHFGAAVAIYGNTIAVGAPNHQLGTHVNSGRVYLYTINFSTSDVSLQGTVDGSPADNAAT